MSTLAELKSKIFGNSEHAMGLNPSETTQIVDGKSVVTKDPNWMRHWDNDNRISVSVHRDLLPDVKTATNLGLQVEQRSGEKGAYTSYRIVRYAEAELTI